MIKPPIGLYPRWLWLEFLEVPTDPTPEEKHERELDIRAAIKRYIDAGLIPPKEWFDELILT